MGLGCLCHQKECVRRRDWGSRRFGRAVCADGPDATSQPSPPFLSPDFSRHLLTRWVPEQPPAPAPGRSQALVAPSAPCFGSFSGSCLARPTTPLPGLGSRAPGRQLKKVEVRWLEEGCWAGGRASRRGEGSRDPLRGSFALPRAPLFRFFFPPSLYELLYIFTVRRGKGVLPHFVAFFLFFFYFFWSWNYPKAYVLFTMPENYSNWI